MKADIRYYKDEALYVRVELQKGFEKIKILSVKKREPDYFLLINIPENTMKKKKYTVHCEGGKKGSWTATCNGKVFAVY